MGQPEETRETGLSESLRLMAQLNGQEANTDEKPEAQTLRGRG